MGHLERRHSTGLRYIARSQGDDHPITVRKDQAELFMLFSSEHAALTNLDHPARSCGKTPALDMIYMERVRWWIITPRSQHMCGTPDNVRRCLQLPGDMNIQRRQLKDHRFRAGRHVPSIYPAPVTGDHPARGRPVAERKRQCARKDHLRPCGRGKKTFPKHGLNYTQIERSGITLLVREYNK